jgi:hypothetical protein
LSQLIDKTFINMSDEAWHRVKQRVITIVKFGAVMGSKEHNRAVK